GSPGDFLLRHNMLEVTEAETAPFLFDGDPVQSELTHLRPKVARELVRLVNFGGDRSDLVGGETLGRLADRVTLFPGAQIEAGVGHHRSPVRWGASRARSV